jgi:hypothetical protein
MMSSDDDEDELLTLLSPASHAAQFPRRFSDDEDDDDDEDSSSADELVSTLLGGGAGSSGRPAAAAAASPQGARAAVATNPLYGADNLQRQWSTTLSDGDSSLSDDSDDSEEDVGFDEAEAERMRKEYETYQRERAERAKAAEAAEQARTSAVQAYVVGGSDGSGAAAPHLQVVAQALRANRQLQERIKEQLDRLEGARLENAKALSEWQQDERRVRQADRTMRGNQKRQLRAAALLGGKSSTMRYRRGGSYFGRDAPTPGDDATMQARRTLVDLVPLTYPTAKWAPAETESLRTVVRQTCQQRAMVLIDRQLEQEDVAERHFGGAGSVPDEEDEYTRQVNELRGLTLLQLLERLEEAGAIAGVGGGAGGVGGGGGMRAEEEELLNWGEIAKRSRLRRTADDCHVHWSAVADPRIDVSDWTDRERDDLKRLAEEHEGHSWERIASQIGACRRERASEHAISPIVFCLLKISRFYPDKLRPSQSTATRSGRYWEAYAVRVL